MNTLHARGGRIIPKLPIYEYPHETFLKNTSMVIRLFTRTKNFDAKFRFSKVESLVGGVGPPPPPPPPPYSHMADYHTTDLWSDSSLTHTVCIQTKITGSGNLEMGSSA